MANIEKLDEQTNVGRELTDEEIDMVAGGKISRGPEILLGLETIVQGFKDLAIGDTQKGHELIQLGWAEILGKAI